MAVVARGAGGYLGIGVESVWGTAVARSNWLRAATLGLMRRIANSSETDLGAQGRKATTRRYPFVASDFADGSISWPASYNDSTVLLLSHILGDVDTEGPDGTEYTHTVTVASPPPIGLTLEQISGVAPSGSALANKMSEVFEGCKFSGARISCTAGQELMIDADVIAQTSGGLVAAGTPTVSPSFEPILHNHRTSLTLGGTAREINGFTITIERDLQRNQELGSKLTSEPFEGPEGVKVSVELRCKWQTDAYDAALLAGSQSDLEIVFTGSGDNSLTITAHNLQIDSVDRAVSDRGAIEQVIKGTCYTDANDDLLTMVFTNSKATAATN